MLGGFVVLMVLRLGRESSRVTCGLSIAERLLAECREIS
jgi:hypothetical protein